MQSSASPQSGSTAPAVWSRRVFAAVTFAALLGIVPLLIKGNVAAHDLQFHISSWTEVAQQWRHGTVWPRWAAGANYGFGEPRFIFYPPASWLLGGLLALWLPVRALPAAFSFIAFFAAGCGMFALARKYLNERSAIAAAMLYALNPYHLITVYWDFRVAEMLASAVFPVAILYTLECAEKDQRKIAPLAVSVAAVWLANAPAAVMLMYTLALLFCVLVFLKRSVTPIIQGAAGMILGLGLAAFYIIPAAFEQSWVNILGIFGSGLTPKENFLFSVATDAPHTYFNFLVSGIALEEVVLFAFAVFFALRVTREDRRWATAVAIAGTFAALMMFKVSLWLWSLPKMQFVQFPWRWMLVLNVALVLLGVIALRQARLKVIWVLLIVAFLGFTVRDVIRQATWGRRAVAEMYWSTSSDGYRGAKEYLPSKVHVPQRPYLLQQVPLAELICQLPCLHSEVTVQRWSADEKRIRVDTPVPAKLALKLFSYPGWSVAVDGKLVEYDFAYQGHIEFEVPAGNHSIRVWFARTEDQTLGIIVSVLAAAILLAFLYVANRRGLTLDASN
jgi:hypothetical protein